MWPITQKISPIPGTQLERKTEERKEKDIGELVATAQGLRGQSISVTDLTLTSATAEVNSIGLGDWSLAIEHWLHNRGFNLRNYLGWNKAPSIVGITS